MFHGFANENIAVQEVLILGVYLEIFFFRITWSKIRVRIIHGHALCTGKYGTASTHADIT